MRTCTDCGEEAQGPDQPCAVCGSARQTVTVYAQGAIAVASSGVPGLSVKYAQSRPWYEQWHAVREQLASAEDSLSSYHGNDRVKREFENFFTKCYHLIDWIGEDPSTGLSTAQVRAFVANDPSLKICEGMANTTKHHTRRKSTDITAQIASITSGAHGASATVDWTDSTNTGTEDVLSLAKRCIAAWSNYMAANGLQSPI